MFPPAPGFTESSLPDLHGKVYIVTGASAGVGKELSRLLYSRNGVVYVAARSSEKASAAISWIKEAHPESKGTLHYLHLDLGDLDGIKASAEAFLKNETRLDVLFNNAGVMVPPKGTTTKQGYELQLGTNCVAPFLFTKALTPMLIETAKKEPKGSVRVIWVSSSAATLVAPTGGVDMDNLNYKKDVHQMTKYGISKGGNVLHAMEFQRRYEEHGIVSVVSLSVLLPIIHFHHQLLLLICSITVAQPRQPQIRTTTPYICIPTVDPEDDNVSACQRRVYRVIRWSRARCCRS
jgi:NAD(P)-dependent dehydrogenase (short-subunit alcohol dehydrogenase family)